MSDSKRRPVDYDEMYPGRFLKAGLLQTKLGSRTPIVTIIDVELEELPQDDGKNKDRGILTLKESTLQICLNRTNGDCLKAMFGTKPSRDWIGKRIGLCVELDRDPSSKNGKVDAIRIAGSPDIEDDVIATIKLPKRKPKDRTLRKLTVGATSKPQQTTQPLTKPEPAPVTEKPRGDITATLAHIATLGDEGKAAFQVELRGKYNWTKEEGAQLVAAFETP